MGGLIAVVFAFTAWDPANATLQASDAALAHGDRVSLSEASAKLVNLYKGNQRSYVHEELGKVIKDPVTLSQYRALATTFNVVALLVDRVAMYGREPLQVRFFRGEADAEDEDSGKLWGRLALDARFDAFNVSLGRFVELVKTSVVSATWDERRGRVRLRLYTPNVIDVDYAEGNSDHENPDAYAVLQDSSEKRVLIYDFSREEEPVTYTRASGATSDEKPWELRTRDGEKPLVPFVAFRTAWPHDSYFVQDGQEDLLDFQESINRDLTHLAINAWHGTYQMPIFEGGGWEKTVKLPVGPTVGLRAPSPDPLNPSSKPTVRWDGPGSVEIIRVLGEIVNERIDEAAASFHMNPQSVRARTDALSGLALYLESEAQRQKLKTTRTQLLEPAKELVEVMVATWNAVHPAGPQFPADVRIEVAIPDVLQMADPKDDLDNDVISVREGFRDLEDVIRKRNPGKSAEYIKGMAEKAEKRLSASAAVPQQRAGIFGRRPAVPGPTGAGQ